MDNGRLHVKGIMFDLDGTLLDTKPAYMEAAKAAFAAFGQNAPTAEAALEIPKRMEQRLPLSGVVNVELKSFLNVYLSTFYSVSPSKTKPFPYAAQALSTLAPKAKLAVITMRYVPCEAVVRELAQYGLDSYFAHIVTAMDTHKPKPSPEALIKIVAAMDVDMCDCLIVGDSVVDVAAGKAAGAKTVSVLTGLYSRGELENARPDYIIPDVSHLPSLLA
jgi:phosphoglycolate phosphatase-like HAD superfamily hydrolase